MPTAMTAHLGVRMGCRAKLGMRKGCGERPDQGLASGRDRAPSVVIRFRLREDLKVETEFVGGLAHRVRSARRIGEPDGPVVGEGSRRVSAWSIESA